VTTETTKITRMQQRRGLKQDLPKPLRPGEIGFATDTRQVFIGADTADQTAQIFNKTCVFETTASAQSITTSFADTQIVKFTVPHKFFNRNQGVWDGISRSASWLVTDVAGTALGDRVFRTSDTVYTDVIRNSAFLSENISVVRNGVPQKASAVSAISSGADYFFSAGTTASDPHTLTFRTSPSNSEEIGVVYYGNAAIADALARSGTIGNTAITGFYNNQQIPEHRQIDPKNITVTPDTGVGYLGLQFKHIAVSTDVKHPPLSADVNNLGFMLMSRDDDQISASITTSGNNIEVSGVNLDDSVYDLSGNVKYTYIQDATGWVNNKPLEISSVSSNTLLCVLPSNTTSVVTNVSNVSVSGNTTIIVVPSTNGIAVGDTVYLLDPANIANVNNQTANVVSVTTSTLTVNYGFTNDSDPTNVSGNVSFITYKAGVNTSILFRSTNHGLSATDSITLSNTAITGGSPVSVVSVPGEDAFVATTVIPVTQNITPMTFSPVISTETVSATPVLSADLTATNTIMDIILKVNSLNSWPRMTAFPTDSTKLLVTHNEAFQKTAFAFRLHNDSAKTVSKLGLVPDSYDRTDATVKAKLEIWLASLLNSQNINLFSDVFMNTAFSNLGFDNWSLGINTTLGEVEFSSRSEARDFSNIINRLYYESINPDIRGLLNIKTNIELQTREAAESAPATSNYNSPEVITIPPGISVAVELGADVTDVYDTFLVEYSIKDTFGDSSTDAYRRMGSLMYTGDARVAETLLVDSYNELTAGTVSGNVSFSSSMAGDNLVVTTNNTLGAGNSVVMKYIVRRWSS
jgi:hypothetical protein